MIKRATGWILALCVLLPSVTEGQDPMLVAEGAQVFGNTCNRCHNARSGTERTDAQWRPIVLHMRVRANLTKSQAEAVLAFLRATNVPEGPASSASATIPAEAPDVVLPPALRAALTGDSARGTTPELERWP